MKGLLYSSKKCGVLLIVCSLYLLSGCSLTKNLPKGEVLYTGQKTKVLNESKTRTGQTAMTEIHAALDKTPSTKIMEDFCQFPLKCGCIIIL